ncbi:BREX-4 system phosphatase PglZ [uncultured Alistipes sp.]|uniref:BREX-4 system phosphatase PglZ n=1 Tax=uncultured Alistipes sp. TaxID=538949 RepID=UPI002584B0DB|nr:BREX-4 system phosphatase PglZ [uncultured Alistipes sp.]
MYRVFDSLESLYAEMAEDKKWKGAESTLRNRYPLRFVLFENFSDFYDFVDKCGDYHVHVQSLDGWMPDGCNEQLITYSQLAQWIEDYVKHLPYNDYVIAPFSEIARFYDNEIYAEFDSLVKTIRLIEPPECAQQGHQRIYVPIIGMQGKMDRFKNDPNIHIWEYLSGKDQQNYKLILTRGTTYGVKGLEQQYTLCENLRQWIGLWKVGNEVKKQIICSSKTIFDNAHYARPDNAFDYIICENVLQFLNDGLGMGFSEMFSSEADLAYWKRFAADVDVSNFDFDAYINGRFNTYTLFDEKDFVHTWFEFRDDFSRWLLRVYYLVKHKDQTYLSRVLSACTTQSTTDLFSRLATRIFEEQFDEVSLRQRQCALCEAGKHHVQITEQAEQKIQTKLRAIAENQEIGYDGALKYVTALTPSERYLLIEWLGQQKIDRESIKELFPELYYYTAPLSLGLEEENVWVNAYFDAYRQSKITNGLTAQLAQIIKEKNTSVASFELWKDNFKTVKTLLYGRADIDVFYWIDGLGVDWIPFIAHVIEQRKVDGVYLNEIHIGTAQLPTTTSVNRIKLEELASGKLHKISNIDTYAHTTKCFPNYIVEEMAKVKEAIESVLVHYNGKKIAFVSDHGISYLAQYGTGLNLAGFHAEHAGRCASSEKRKISQDDQYIIVDDDKTICSLSHNSLSSKTPMGQGAHGGATPEEVLVPIIIVSSQKNAAFYSVRLLDDELSAMSPKVRYSIKGLTSIDHPKVIYNNVEYMLHKIADDTYESDRLNLMDAVTSITLVIGEYSKKDSLIIKTGVKEDDLFGDL